MTNHEEGTFEPLHVDVGRSETQTRVDSLQTERKRISKALMESGATLGDMVNAFDNNYTPLEELYREKTGVDLIGDPYEVTDHEISITKSCSMVIPAYNAGEQLHKTLLAAQASTFNAKYPGQFEVIVVDDESPAVNIGEVVSTWDDISDLNIKVLRQTNGRENKGRYSGILHAQGDVVLFTSQDIVLSLTTIEEYMKRHEVLGDIVCFAMINEIDPNNPLLDRDHIAHGSLGELPVRFDYDYRIREDGMTDTNWLKDGGKDKPLPIHTNDEQSWSWHLRDVTWSASVSAPRDVLLKTMCSYDNRYKGYGSDEGQLTADLIAEGMFVIPNTGGMAFHQTHTTRNNPYEEGMNEQIYQENLSHPPCRQDSQHPMPTDAQEVYERKNERTKRRETIGMPKVDAYKRATALSHMGLYDKALPLFEENAEQYRDNAWFLFDHAHTLLALGGAERVNKAIALLDRAEELDPQNEWIHIGRAKAYGRRGEEGDYNRAKDEYERVRSINPHNPQVQFLNADNDLHQEATRLHRRAYNRSLNIGKPRASLDDNEKAIILVGETGIPWAVFDKGKALLALGQKQEAIKVLERAVALMPHETWTHSQLGIAYYAAGETDKARTALVAALTINPHNAEALQLLDELK